MKPQIFSPLDKHSRCDRCSASCPFQELKLHLDVFVDFADQPPFVESVSIKSGKTLYSADEPASFVYCIRAGLVKLVKDCGTGTKRIVRIVECDGVIGMETMFASVFQHTAIAVRDVVACRVPSVKLKHMIQTYPSLQLRLLEKSLKIQADVENWLSEFAGGSGPAHARMARLLLRLRDGQSNRAHRLSLKDISALLGVTIETACRSLAELKCARLLDATGTEPAAYFYQADFEGLKKLAYLESSPCP